MNTQTRLYDLGIFSQVDTAVQNPEGADPQKNVLVQVREAKRYTFTYGLGLEFQTGQPPERIASGQDGGKSPRRIRRDPAEFRRARPDLNVSVSRWAPAAARADQLYSAEAIKQ